MPYPRRLAACAAAILCLAAASPASAAQCLTPKEMRASQVRQLQTELMVAALSCARHPQFDLTTRYNQFVRKFGPHLNTNARVLRSYFARAYGKNQHRKFDAYITTLANEASMSSLGVAGFCESVSPLFEKVLTLSEPELESFAAANVVPKGGVTACADH